MDDRKLTRDYDTAVLKKHADSRFHWALKDCVVIQSVYFAQLIIAIALAYILCPDDPSAVTFIIGIPSWLFYACIAPVAGTLGTLIYYCRSRRFSLAPRGTDEEVND